MKNIFFTVLLLSACNFAYAQDMEAKNFARDYEQEKKQEAAQEQGQALPWNFTGKLNLAAAYYEEDEQGIKSDFNAFYPEVSFSAEKEIEGDLQFMANTSFGMSLKEDETWKLNGLEFQRNGLDFSRFNIGAGFGKILYSNRDKNLRAIPYIDYRFRYIYFSRSNFTIFSTPANVDPISEKYYLHNLGVGLKVDKKFNDKVGMLGSLGFGYFVYNAAHNSALGTVEGSGGYLAYGSLDFTYSLTGSWNLLGGAFVDYQHLSGGEKSGVIWPDNTMTIFGGDLALKYTF